MPVLDNARHERYAQELASGKTADEAYQLAGYSANRGNASRMKADESIAARVVEILAAAGERVEITKSYVLGTIKDTVERCRQSKPVLDRKGKPVVVETPDGDLTPAYAFDAPSVLRGAELLGKHLGMFTEKHELTGANGKDLIPDVADIELARAVTFMLTKASREKPSSTH